MEKTNGLVMGTPNYLESKVDEPFTDEDLKKASKPHPARPKINSGLQKWEDYAMFWSLCFGISKTNFIKIGGFDERYTGYGGEDTDFAFMAKDRGVDFYLSDATVFHQPHTVYSPPVNHLNDIVKNSTAFKNKWGWWPMENWLNDFEEMGLIERSDSDEKHIQKLRDVDTNLLHQCKNEVAAFK
jgi:hypothetical protein